MTDHPLALIVMGSDSDWEVMRETASVFKAFQIPFEMRVASAHRTPERTHHLIAEAAGRGIQVIIAGAGAAAHLAGVAASHTHLPVIGVPLAATDLGGLDALLATAQMPSGVPVASMAIGKAGAKNAGIFAVQILALADAELASRLIQYRQEMTQAVEAKDLQLQQRLQAL